MGPAIATPDPEVCAKHTCAPAPTWSVLERRMVMVMCEGVTATSEMRSAISSLRRRLPKNPTTSHAASRASKSCIGLVRFLLLARWARSSFSIAVDMPSFP
jgi:hypothetical protein